ncbi:MAG: RNA polymerase sigma factor [Rhizomicrobium sp.]
MDETKLIARAAAGDSAAFALLVRQHQSGLRGFLRRLTRNDPSLADDIAQEAFLECWRKLSHDRGDGSFAGWLNRIAWSRFLMEARKRKPELLEDLPEQSYEASPDTKLDLESAMAKLSAGERAALTLCTALGHSNEEAAAILAMPLGTVKSHVLRGREKLRAMLEAGS